MKASNPNEHPEDGGLEAPPRLAVAFRNLPQQRIFIPCTLDEAVLGETRRRLRKRVMHRLDWSLLRFWLPAAAVIIFVGLLAYLFSGTFLRAPRQPLLVREDLNHDGRVDILDAFALARAIKSEASLDHRLDINGDGVIDERDVATIAAQAVKLQKRGHS
jgi:hypothetical protein